MPNVLHIALLKEISIVCETRQAMNVYNILLKVKSERPFSIRARLESNDWFHELKTNILGRSAQMTLI